ncbi:MAG: 3-phosphoshikimate 1-carboxyvinyltransferase [Thermoplasmata archaeon]|nr:3-phosphoshikimate 1-carboxyvinyltransferase [Thermoplasmata archaeon]
MIRSSTARGTILAPPSKSYTHRSMVLGALTHSAFTLRHPLISEDTRATLDALQLLGASITGTQTDIDIICDKLAPAAGIIDAKNSGTTMRLVTGLASLLPTKTTITGDASLIKRPMAPLIDALTQLGARCEYKGVPGNPPLTVTGPITNDMTTISGAVSSQFISSLIIACTQKQTDTDIEITGGLVSKPYVDITLEMLREFGARVDTSENAYHVPGNQRFVRDSYTVPGDYSSAAFLFAAGAITDGDVTVKNLDAESPQGDKAILDHLKGFGADVTVSDDFARVQGGKLEGLEIDVGDTPDLFPVLAVIGAVADGKTVLKGGRNLKQKESDRILTTTDFLRDMGARVKPTEDGCEILGGDKLRGASIQTHGDHRILMAAVLAALVSTSGTTIDDDESYKVSYPGFLRDMHQLGCRLEVRR